MYIELDPSLADGHKIVFDKEVPIEMRAHQDSNEVQDVGNLEAVRVKILVLVYSNFFCNKYSREMTNELSIFV